MPSQTNANFYSVNSKTRIHCLLTANLHKLETRLSLLHPYEIERNSYCSDYPPNFQ